MKGRLVISFALCLLVISMASLTCNAATDYQLMHGPDLLSNERLENIQTLKDRVNSEPMTRASGGNILSGVQNEQQINSYYCGPACTKNVLKYLGVNKTQNTLGSEMSTNQSNGTYVYRIVNCLNSHLGSGTYKYVLTSEIAFGSGLRSSIDKNKPVICHTMTGVLPVYSSYGKNTGHYVVATGYSWAAQGSTGYNNVTYNDPNNDSRFYGTQTCSWNLMQTAINNNAGYYIMS